MASFANWPGGAWEGGRFDYVIAGRQPGPSDNAYFVLGSEYIVVDLDAGAVNSPPTPLANFYGGAALALLTDAGRQAVLVDGSILDPAAALTVLRGPVAYKLANATGATPPQVSYIAQQDPHWPAAWHPVLKQAPAGAIGSLWSLDAGGIPFTNTGSGWTAAALPNNAPALALDCGADGSVYAAGGGALFQMDASGSWTQAAAPGFTLQGVTVGDSGYVWVTDDQGTVYRFAGGAFTPANLGVPAGDAAASPDGTLWHCRAGAPDAYRFVAQGQLPSEAIPIGLGVTSVQKAAGTSFGKAFFLAQQNGQSALISYTSPYHFKTPASYTTGFMQRIATGASTVFVPHIAADQTQISITGLDVQTGAERWSYAYAADAATAANFLEQQGAAPLYDAAHQLVYVFQYHGVIDALDAQTGVRRWSLPLAQLNLAQAVIPVQPILAAGGIYVAAADDPAAVPNSTMLYLVAVDTSDAAAHAARASPWRRAGYPARTYRTKAPCCRCRRSIMRVRSIKVPGP